MCKDCNQDSGREEFDLSLLSRPSEQDGWTEVAFAVSTRDEETIRLLKEVFRRYFEIDCMRGIEVEYLEANVTMITIETQNEEKIDELRQQIENGFMMHDLSNRLN